MENILPSNEALLRNEKIWSDLIEHIESSPNANDEVHGIDLNDLIACCEAEDGSDVEFDLDELQPQCYEDTNGSEQEFFDPEERRLVLAGEAPHFDESFKESLRILINDRLRQLRERNIELRFSGSFERNHERFQEHIINQPGFQSFSRSYERSSDILRLSELPSPCIQNHYFGTNIDKNFKRSNQVQKIYQKKSDPLNHLKLRVLEFEINCKSKDKLASVVNSLKSMSRFGNDATAIKYKKPAQIEGNFSDTGLLNERSNAKVKFSLVSENPEIKNKIKAQTTSINYIKNSLADEDKVHLKSKGSEKSKNQQDSFENIPLKGLKVILKKCKVPTNFVPFGKSTFEVDKDKQQVTTLPEKMVPMLVSKEFAGLKNNIESSVDRFKELNLESPFETKVFNSLIENTTTDSNDLKIPTMEQYNERKAVLFKRIEEAKRARTLNLKLIRSNRQNNLPSN